MIDLEYLCAKIADMSGLPIRIYHNNQLCYYYCVVDLLCDPIDPYKEEIFSSNKHIDYYLTEDFDCYGILNSQFIKVVIGPSISNNATQQTLRRKAFLLNVPVKQTELFVQQLNSLIRMPLNSILQMLCTINYILNDEKINLQQLQIDQQMPINPQSEPNKQDSNRGYLIEKTLCNFIKNGDVIGFEQWVKNAPTVQAGKISNDTIRQSKNIFVVSATLFSRNAIEAGMDVNEALTLSDHYIQQSESKDSIEKITTLQFMMLKDYINRVASLKQAGANGYLAKKIFPYIHDHLSESISTDDLANYLHLSRSYLSSQFKKKNGINLNHFIHLVKINYAKELLTQGNNTILSISTYLGYSSSGHFTKMFERIVGISPIKYRNQFK